MIPGLPCVFDRKDPTHLAYVVAAVASAALNGYSMQTIDFETKLREDPFGASRDVSIRLYNSLPT